jgi:hypothetical protein
MMNISALRYLAFSATLLLIPAVGWAVEATSQPAALASGERKLDGKVVSFDPATRELKIAWRHRSQREMDISLVVDPSAAIMVDGKPAKATDLKPGMRIAATGQARGMGANNRFVASRIETVAAPAATAPAASGVDPRVDQVLDRLERKGDQVKDIETPIRYTKMDPVLEDKQVFQGILRFKEDKPNPHFFIRFDKFTQEGITRDTPEWHVFDGQWYIEAREKTHTIVKRQIVRPGEEVNVFRIGQGPFPLPFGQKKADILKYFDVKLVPPTEKDPPNSVHLECTPKPGTDMAEKYGSIHFYIDKQLDLPVVVRTVEKSENVEVTAEFPADKIKINTGMAACELNLPELKGYQVDTVPLAGPEQPARSK